MADAGTVSGEAIVYNSLARIGGMFDETIAPGAVREFLASKEVAQVALVRDHDPSILLARVGSGTLELHDSPAALRIRARLADTTSGRETAEVLRRGDLYSMSFSFVMDPADETWHEGENGVPLRVVRRIKRMFDVSVVTWPAYDDTSVKVEGPGVRGARLALARRQLDASADAHARWEHRTFGERLYGKRVTPSAAVLAKARGQRRHLTSPQAATAPVLPRR